MNVAPFMLLNNGRQQIITIAGILIASLTYLESTTKVPGLSSERLSSAMTVIAQTAMEREIAADQRA